MVKKVKKVNRGTPWWAKEGNNTFTFPPELGGWNPGRIQACSLSYKSKYYSIFDRAPSLKVHSHVNLIGGWDPGGGGGVWVCGWGGGLQLGVGCWQTAPSILLHTHSHTHTVQQTHTHSHPGTPVHSLRPVRPGTPVPGHLHHPPRAPRHPLHPAHPPHPRPPTPDL